MGLHTFSDTTKRNIMTTPIIGLFVLLVIALIGWAVAETKNKVIKFEHSKAEEEGYEEMQEAFEHDGGKELSLKDLLKRNYTKGYQSI